jgi:type IV pilus assembly protein PilB
MTGVNVSTVRDLERVLQASRPVPEVQLGKIMLAQHQIGPDQLANALKQQQREPDKHLGRILVENGVATKEQVHIALAQKFGIPFVKLQDFTVSEEARSLIPADIAMQYNVLPLAKLNGRLVVAMENPLDWQALAVIRFHTNLSVDAVLSSAEDIGRELSRHYAASEEKKVLQDLDLNPVVPEAEGPASVSVIEQEARKAPIVRLVNALILDGVMRGASDINVRPEADRVSVYYRVDGKLQFVRSLHRSVLAPLVSRIKIVGRMNIAERRLPQDGHARVVRKTNVIDLRISVIPTVSGESVVIRILDKDVGLKPLDEVGFQPSEMNILRQILSRSFGMFLVTGPTGSGKSTTLYALLNEIRARNPHIITVEDPVEYDMEGVEQIQIYPATGYTFAEALRHILRHDPDVIMVGEIRDLETARIANKAALTGHLVLSTLHTNDAASAVTRLVDMGIEPFLLGSTLLGVMAQRLVRLNCPFCKAPEPVEPVVREALHLDDAEVFYRSTGCTSCNRTGYRGRTAVCELLAATPEIAALINAGRPDQEIKRAAVGQGMTPLTQNALGVARQGLTSLQEVFALRLE